MRAAICLVLTALLAAPAAAQDWATRDVCKVETPEIVDSAFAPATRATLEDEAAEIPNGIGRFWRIETPGGAVSHLFGTYHSADPLILDLPQAVLDAIAEARTVAVEIDFTYPDRQAYRDAQMMTGRFKEPSDAFDFSEQVGTFLDLPPEVDGWLRERASELGWGDEFDLVMSKPGVVEMLLSDPCEDFASGVLPIQDDYIQLLGRLAGARILSLEGPDEMIADLAESDDTARAIIYTYAAYLKPADSNAERATSFALYLEGRLGMLQAWDHAYQHEVYGPDATATLGLTDDYLLDQRNRRFVNRLSGALPVGGTFVAVGSAHIPGRQGLVALLRDAGHTVTRISLPGETP